MLLQEARAGSLCRKLVLEGHTPPSLRDTPSILEGEQVTQLHGKGWGSSVKYTSKKIFFLETDLSVSFFILILYQLVRAYPGTGPDTGMRAYARLSAG